MISTDRQTVKDICAKRYIEPEIKIDCNRSLYDTYSEANANRDDAVVYFKKSGAVLHRDFKNAVNHLSAGIYKISEKKENIRVGALLVCQEEVPLVLLSVNKLGGLIKFVNVIKAVPDIIEDLTKSNFDLLIMDEMFIGLDRLAGINDLPIIIINATKDYDKERYVLLEEAIESGRDSVQFKADYTHNKPAIIISSSGTTGAPKPIIHSNESVNSAVVKMLHTDLMLNPKNVMLNCVPPFIGLGLVTTVYTALIAGTPLVFVSGNGPEESVQNVGRFVKEFKEFKRSFGLTEDAKLNLFGAPIFYRYIASCDEIDDLSFLGGMLSAGSKMGKQELKNINEVFAKRGCNLPVCNGYGQNEMCGAVTLNSITHNQNGSGGFLTIDTDILIIDPDTNEILDIGHEGKILERSTSQFLEYENMPDETENAFVTIEGQKWFDTKDLGYFDEDGYIHITGRVTRVIIRQDIKLATDTIESKIKNHPMIFDCAVIPRQTDVDEEPVAFVVKNGDSDMDTIIKEIQESDSPLSHLEIPVMYLVLDKMPYLGSGKIDYRALKKYLK